MSKTFKTDINQARFHNRLDDLDTAQREKGVVMDKHWAGARHGNNRNRMAEIKVQERRKARAVSKREILEY